jgi:hypothetical protein
MVCCRRILKQRCSRSSWLAGWLAGCGATRLASLLEGVVFAHKVLETRVIADLQQRQQRY